MTFAEQFLNERFPVMGQEKMNVAMGQMRNNAGTNESHKRIRSNTTVFAIMYNKGVILAGDRRTSDGYLGIESDTSTKVMKLSELSGMACAGYCNVISSLEENMEAVSARFLEMYKQPLSPDGQAMYMRRLLEGWWYFSVYTWYWTVGLPILAAYDKQQKRPRIFGFSEDGYFMEPKFFAGTGCGFDFIKGTLIDGWHDKITENETVKLAVKALILSGATSHGVSDARLVLPTVSVIDANGFRWVTEGRLKEYRDELVKKMGGLQCLLA